jgi:hypothetical protein
LDLPLSARVKQRAKMFVDLAVVEAEQASIRGVRGGVKARSKKDSAGHHDGLNHSMIGRMGAANSHVWSISLTVVPRLSWQTVASHHYMMKTQQNAVFAAGYSLFGLETQVGGAGRTPWVNLDTNLSVLPEN